MNRELNYVLSQWKTFTQIYMFSEPKTRRKDVSKDYVGHLFQSYIDVF